MTTPAEQPRRRVGGYSGTGDAAQMPPPARIPSASIARQPRAPAEQPRVSGDRWRVLAANEDGSRLDVNTSPDEHTTLDARGLILDEVVLQGWLHLEAMGAPHDHPDGEIWWLHLAGLDVTVATDAHGKPVRVVAEWDEPVAGCEYSGELEREGSDDGQH